MAVASLTWMGTLWFTSLPVTLFRPFESFQDTYPQPQVGWSVYMTLSRFDVEYDPDYDMKKMGVFMQNHVSVLDANIGCGSIPVPICGLENASHLNVPGYGWLLKMANAIPVKKGARNFKEVAEAFRERASRGISILSFPEAHRTKTGKIGKLKRGVFKIAVESGIPIAPVCVRGAYEVLPKGALTIRPGRVHVYLPPQIETENLTQDDVPELMARVEQVMRAWVEDGVKRPDICLKPFASPEPLATAAEG